LRKPILTLGAGLVAASVVIVPVVTATTASAASPPHLTGSVNLDNPDQYVAFNNISGTSSGSLTYTNFTYPDPGSGVWSLPQGTPINYTVSVGAAYFNHTLIVDSIEPNGASALSFTGHGFWADLYANGAPVYNWTATGTVSGTSLKMHIVYTTGNPGYTADLTGTVASGGSVSGTATDSAGTAGLTISMPAGSLFEALAYTAPVNTVHIGTTTASFRSAIPVGHALAGTSFGISVTDGGNPGVGHDTYTQDGAGYVIDDGNLTVH
jgi:hypothetical protein